MQLIHPFASVEALSNLALSLLSVYLLWTLQTAIANVRSHALSKFPGPKLAAASTIYKAFIEGILQISWHKHLVKLHAEYGPIVRVGPNELHFSDPQAYHDIHNNANRWDKEETLYRSFGEDRSSFGFLTYKESKERKDVLNKSFSLRSILEAQGLVQGKIDDLCSAFTSLAKSGRLANLSNAYRCMTMDIITTYCFGTSVDAIHAPDFQAPIVQAMDATQPVFIWFKHSSLYRNMILKCPRPLSRIISPPTVGLVDLQEILETQIEKLVARPEELDHLPHRSTVYHSLLDKSNYKSGAAIPPTGSLYEEAQALMFGGGDTVGNTMMVMTFHLCQPQNRHHLNRLQSELRQAYPHADENPPPISALESLPFLNAVIKESLRLNSGVISGLPRIVPSTGATIAKTPIPPGTIVSISSTFVHYNTTIFPEPHTFNPDRWLSKQTPNGTDGVSDLDYYLVAFSRGPRSCLGINLAWVELRLTTACVFRRFEMELDPATAPAELTCRDTFLPMYTSGPVNVRIKTLA